MSKKGEVASRVVDLPAELRTLFWDHDFHRFIWEKDRDLIISRILSHGDWQALEWLRVPILDLPLPEPRPRGAEWIDAFRRWAKGA